jgi:hypothetical protein
MRELGMRSFSVRASLMGLLLLPAATSCSAKASSATTPNTDAPFGSASATFSAVSGANIDASSFRATELTMRATAATTPSEGCLVDCNATVPSLLVTATEGARTITLAMTLYDGAVTTRAVLDSGRITVFVAENGNKWVGDAHSTGISATVASGGHVTIAMNHLSMGPAPQTQTVGTFQMDATVSLDCEPDSTNASYAQCKSANAPALP